MQGTDASCHVVIVHMAKAALLHQGLEFLLAWMHADRLGQVAVAFGIAGNQPAHGRQDSERVPVVDLFKRLGDFGI